MTHGIDLDSINPYDEKLLRTQTVALVLAIDKVNQFVAKGHTKEAHGARAVVRIMWQAFNEEVEIDTGWGGLT